MFLLLLRRFMNARVVARVMALVLMTVLTVPVFGSLCCAGIEPTASLGEAQTEGDGCCPGEGTAPSSNPSDEGEKDRAPCSCPFPCSASCAGYLGRMVVPMSAVAMVEPAPALVTLRSSELAKPAHPDPRDILHVPKIERV